MISQILKKNKNLKNNFYGQECYIFGNGLSIKNYDLKEFNNKFSFTCGWLFLHKDYSNLNVIVDVEVHPGIFFPFWKNHYRKKFEYNIPNYIFRKNNRLKKSKMFFTSLTNMPALLNYKNNYYIYHFGKKKFDHNFMDPSGTFSLMENSLYSMIGIASYMGFKKIFLIGMDYLLEESVAGHFYENYKKTETLNLGKIDHKQYLRDRAVEEKKYFFDTFQKKIEFVLIKTEDSSGSFLDNVKYSSFFGTEEKKYKNIDIVSDANLHLLNKSRLNYQIY